MRRLSGETAGVADSFILDFIYMQGFGPEEAWVELLTVALEALAILNAPNKAVQEVHGAMEAKARLQGCIACLVTLNTVWEVGKATHLVELTGFAQTDLSSLDKVRSCLCNVLEVLGHFSTGR